MINNKKNPKSEELISVNCPYCGKANLTFINTNIDPRGELVSVPYTRDTGRFDPVEIEDRTSSGGWSQIGIDFLGKIKYERFGILRVPPHSELDIWYRVQYCESCSELFDVYINNSKEKLAQIWPHLFWKNCQSESSDSNNKTSGTSQEIEKIDQLEVYKGESIIISLIRKTGKKVQSNAIATILLGFIVLLIGLFPWLIRSHPDLYAQNSQLFLFCIIGYPLAVTFIVIALITFESFLRNGISINDLEDIFKVVDRNKIIHWYNFTFCRFVGVQKDNKKPGLNQTDVFIGGLSISSVVLTWLFAKHDLSFSTIFILTMLLSMLLFVTTKKIVQIPFFKSNKIVEKIGEISKVFIPLLPLFVGIVFLLSSVTRMSPIDQWFCLFDISSLLFWTIIAYIIGTIAFLALNSSTYVLRGVFKIPMKFSFFNSNFELKPLLKIKKFSLQMMNTVFLFSITLLSLFFVISQPNLFLNYESVIVQFSWLSIWLRWVLVIIFMAVTIGTRITFTAILTLVYVGLEILAIPEIGIGLFPNNFFIGKFQVVIDWSLVIFGIFLTILKMYHSRIIEGIISSCFEKVRKNILTEVNQRIELLHSQLQNLDSTDLDHHLTIVSSINQELELLTNIHKVVEKKKKFNIWNWLLSPFMWSILLPSIWNSLFEKSINVLLKPVSL
ncbi:MAG: hypothetical protein C0412_09170 [Flavobacterium sp.]|nr:hypothetical protein [Flavobacterium sp.]